MKLLILLLAIAHGAPSRTIQLDPSQSAILKKNLSNLAQGGDTLRLDRVVCRGTSINYECDVVASKGTKNSFAFLKAYRVFQALSLRLNPNLEPNTAAGSGSLYNITVTDLNCQGETCTLSTELNDRMQAGR